MGKSALKSKLMSAAKKYWAYVAILVTAAGFFSMIWPIYLTTHDDFWAYIAYFCKDGGMNTFREIWDYTIYFARAFSRVWSIATYPLMLGKIIYASGNYLIYKIFCYGTILFEVTMMYYALKIILVKECAQLITITYFIGAWLDTQHNLFVSYPGPYHLAFGMFWFSIYLMFRNYEEVNSRTQKLSALCYCISCILYENMVPYAILVFLAAYIVYFGKNKSITKAIWNVVRSLKWHMLSMSVYIFITIIWRLLYPSAYNGNVIQFDTIFDVLDTLWVFVKTQIPFYRINDVLRQSVFFDFILDIRKIGYVLKALVAAVACIWIICKTCWINEKRLIAVIVLSEIGAVLSVLLISLTPKYIEWAKMGVTAYLPSYYTYVFHVIALCTGVLLLYQKLPSVLRPFMCLVCFLGIVCLSLCTDYNNENVRDIAFVPQEQRWETFRKVFENKTIISELKEHDQIYVPYHKGIGNTTLDEMQIFAKECSGKELVFYEDIEDMDFGKTAWKLDYDHSQRCMIIGRMEKQISNFYIVGHDSLENRLLIFYENDDVQIDHSSLDRIGESIYRVNQPLDYIFVRGVDEEKLFIADEEKCNYYNQQDIDFTSAKNNAGAYCLKGFSSCEGDFTWSDGEYGYLLMKLSDYQGGDIQLDIDVFQKFGTGRAIICGIDGIILDSELNCGSNRVVIPEENVWEQKLLLRFEYPEAASPGAGDPRMLSIAYRKMKLQYR